MFQLILSYPSGSRTRPFVRDETCVKAKEEVFSLTHSLTHSLSLSLTHQCLDCCNNLKYNVLQSTNLADIFQRDITSDVSKYAYIYIYIYIYIYMCVC